MDKNEFSFKRSLLRSQLPDSIEALSVVCPGMPFLTNLWGAGQKGAFIQYYPMQFWSEGQITT